VGGGLLYSVSTNEDTEWKYRSFLLFLVQLPAKKAAAAAVVVVVVVTEGEKLKNVNTLFRVREHNRTKGGARHLRIP
jgi:hypothetical protein